MRKKRFLASLIIIVMVLSTCFENIVPLSLANGNSSQTYELIFNAYNDFSADENPNLPWKYQYRFMENESYVYYDLEKDTREGVIDKWNTNDYAEIAKTQGDQVTSTTNDVLNLSPWTDSHQAVLTFVAPYSGKINISMTNGGVFAPYSPETGVSFWLLQNEEIKVSKADLGYDDGYHNRFFAGIETLTVEEGDLIRFVIGRNAAIDGRSYFNPEIQYIEMENEKLLFNGYDNFSSDNNPNLPWTYQYRVMENEGYAYYDLEKDTREGAVDKWNTNDYAEIAKTQGDQVTSLTNDVLCLAPWTNHHQAVLTFVAPYSGQMNVSVTNGGVYSPYQSADGVSFWLLRNENEIVSVNNLDSDYNSAGNRFLAGGQTLTVEEGDIIRFVVGRNASIDGRTYFNPQISYTTIVKTTVIEEKLTYNAYNDFSVESNPNDVWSYLRLTNGTYVEMFESDGKWGKGATGYIASTTSDLVTGESVLELRPELPESDMVVRFTAPYSGTVDVSMANGGVFAPHQSKDEIAFTFKHNEDVVKTVADLDSSYNHSTSVGESYVGRFFADTVQLTVQAGDRLEFIVHRNIQVQDPRTYFNPQIIYKTRDNVAEEPINITAVAPTNNDEITIVSDSVLEWTNNYNIEETKFADYMGNGDTYYSGQVRLQWKANKRAEKYIVKYGTDATLVDAKSITTTQTLVEIDNLYADTDYYWQVVGVYEGENVTSDTFKFSTAPTRRTIFMDGVSNTRDLGGIATSDGKTIKQGLIFRGANVDAITDEGKIQATSELGIKTDLDLRSQGETSSATESPIGASINYINVNAPQYALIADYKENVKNIIQVFANEENYPIYYHCQVGRDRTGTVAALLLGLLDVDQEQIYMDYEMSAFSKAGCLDGQEASVLRSQFDALYAYLETYGDDDFSNNVIRFLYDCGVTKEEIASIREIMLGDAGDFTTSRVYYISSSEGSDDNLGTTMTAPWKSFANIKDLKLTEGTKVLLKTGDTWNEQLILNHVSGTKDNPVIIASYGDKEKPVLDLQKQDDSSTDTCELAVPVVLLNHAEGVEISNLSITGSGVGIDFHYQNSFNNEYVKVKNCTFTNLTGFHQMDERVRPVEDRYYMASAITLTITNNCVGIKDPAVIGFYIDKCVANGCGTLYTWGDSPYFLNEGDSMTVRGFYMTDCVMNDNTYYGTLIGGDGGYMDGCIITGCGTHPSFRPGTAGIMVCATNFDIVNTEISGQKRGGKPYDGVGIDLEHSCRNVTVANCYIHDNAGAGMLIFDSKKENNEGTNYDCKIINNFFVNNLTEATGTLTPYNDPYCDIRIQSLTGYALKDSVISGNRYITSKSGYSFYGDYQPQAYRETANNTFEDNEALTSEVDYERNLELSQSCKGKIYDTKGTTADFRAGRTETIENMVLNTYAFTLTAQNPTLSNWTAMYYDIMSTKTWKEMTYDEQAQKRTYGDSGSVEFHNGNVMPNIQGVIATVFCAPSSGRICISMEENISLLQANPLYDGVYITILNGDMELICDPIDLTATNWSHAFSNVYVDVSKGENIYFCLSKKVGNAADYTSMKPVIQYVYTFKSVHTDDEIIDVKDLVRLKKYHANKSTEINAYNADFNGDGIFDEGDATILRTYLVGGYVTRK